MRKLGHSIKGMEEYLENSIGKLSIPVVGGGPGIGKTSFICWFLYQLYLVCQNKFDKNSNELNFNLNEKNEKKEKNEIEKKENLNLNINNNSNLKEIQNDNNIFNQNENELHYFIFEIDCKKTIKNEDPEKFLIQQIFEKLTKETGIAKEKENLKLFLYTIQKSLSFKCKFLIFYDDTQELFEGIEYDPGLEIFSSNKNDFHISQEDFKKVFSNNFKLNDENINFNDENIIFNDENIIFNDENFFKITDFKIKKILSKYKDNEKKKNFGSYFNCKNNLEKKIFLENYFKSNEVDSSINIDFKKYYKYVENVFLKSKSPFKYFCDFVIKMSSSQIFFLSIFAGTNYLEMFAIFRVSLVTTNPIDLELLSDENFSAVFNKFVGSKTLKNEKIEKKNENENEILTYKKKLILPKIIEEYFKILSGHPRSFEYLMIAISQVQYQSSNLNNSILPIVNFVPAILKNNDTYDKIYFNGKIFLKNITILNDLSKEKSQYKNLYIFMKKILEKFVYLCDNGILSSLDAMSKNNDSKKKNSFKMVLRKLFFLILEGKRNFNRNESICGKKIGFLENEGLVFLNPIENSKFDLKTPLYILKKMNNFLQGDVLDEPIINFLEDFNSDRNEQEDIVTLGNRIFLYRNDLEISQESLKIDNIDSFFKNNDFKSDKINKKTDAEKLKENLKENFKTANDFYLCDLHKIFPQHFKKNEMFIIVPSTGFSFNDLQRQLTKLSFENLNQCVKNGKDAPFGDGILEVYGLYKSKIIKIYLMSQSKQRYSASTSQSLESYFFKKIAKKKGNKKKNKKKNEIKEKKNKPEINENIVPTDDEFLIYFYITDSEEIKDSNLEKFKEIIDKKNKNIKVIEITSNEHEYFYGRMRKEIRDSYYYFNFMNYRKCECQRGCKINRCGCYKNEVPCNNDCFCKGICSLNLKNNKEEENEENEENEIDYDNENNKNENNKIENVEIKENEKKKENNKDEENQQRNIFKENQENKEKEEKVIKKRKRKIIRKMDNNENLDLEFFEDNKDKKKNNFKKKKQNEKKKIPDSLTTNSNLKSNSKTINGCGCGKNGMCKTKRCKCKSNGKNCDSNCGCGDQCVNRKK